MRFFPAVSACLGVVAQAGPGGYVHYSGIPAGVSQDMEVEHFWTSIPSPEESQGNAVFASMQFWTEAGAGGYFGTQVWRQGADPRLWRVGSRSRLGTRIGAEEVHQVIFSVWDLDGHEVAWEGKTCERFGGEGTGSHCLIRFPMQAGRKYAFRLALSADNRRLTGVITDLVTGEASTVGTLVFPDARNYSGFGGIAHNAAAFQEYFGSSRCEDQALSAAGLIGPFWRERMISPSSATPSYSKDCVFSDVHACVAPSDEHCGPPHALMLAGGQVARATPDGTELWRQPFPGSQVSCGGHSSDSCANCPEGRGPGWCNGQCTWSGGACSPRSLLASSNASASPWMVVV